MWDSTLLNARRHKSVGRLGWHILWCGVEALLVGAAKRIQGLLALYTDFFPKLPRGPMLNLPNGYISA